MSYVNPFTGQTLSPSQVGYEEITLAADTFLQWPINGNNADVVANIIQVTATASSLKLYLPSAQQVSTGQSVLIQNIGATSFTVTDISGNTIIAIASGIAQYIFLTDNTTNNGTWSTVTFGAGTSSANAAALAGYGLTAINTTINQTYQEATVSSSQTLTSTARAQFLVWTAGVGAITLPSASAVGNGWFVMIRNGGTGILTLTPAGTNTIDGNPSQQLQLTESLVIVSNGIDGYATFAYGRSNVFPYTQLALTVTGGTTTLTAVQYANVIQGYSGVLTSNQIIVLPSTVQIYYLNNQTTGAYSLSFKTAAVGAATVSVPQNSTVTVICDGTNVYSSSSAIIGSISTITLTVGSAAAPSFNYVGDTTTGIYHPGSGQVAITSSGVNVATFGATGLVVPLGIGAGVF